MGIRVKIGKDSEAFFKRLLDRPHEIRNMVLRMGGEGLALDFGRGGLMEEVAGDLESHRVAYQEAVQALSAVTSEEDRILIRETLDRVPAPQVSLIP